MAYNKLNSHNFVDNKLINDEESEEKRLESLSNRISNLKMQYKGILSSGTIPESHTSLYGVNPDVVVGPESRMNLTSSELHGTSLSLSLEHPMQRSRETSYTSPIHSNIDTSISPYLRSPYDKMPADGILDGSYSSMPYSTNAGASSLLSVNKSGGSLATSPAKSHTQAASHQFSKKAAPAASYLSGSSSQSSPKQTFSAKFSDQSLKYGSTLQDANSSSGVSRIIMTKDNLPTLSINSYKLSSESNYSQTNSFNSHNNLEYRNGQSSLMCSSVETSNSYHNDHYQNYYYEQGCSQLAAAPVTDAASTSVSPLPPSDYSNLTTGYNNNSSESLLDPVGPSSLGSFNSHYSPYFKETVEDLGPEEYRWFYKTESDKKWIPFIGYDSLRIEWKFRDLQQNGLSGPLSHPLSSDSISDSGASSGLDTENKSFEVGVEGTVTVRGGLYEIDVRHRRGQSIYWKGIIFNIIYKCTIIFYFKSLHALK